MDAPAALRTTRLCAARVSEHRRYASRPRAAEAAPPHVSPTLKQLLESGRVRILEVAEKQLEGYCSALPTPAERSECMGAVDYYRSRRSAALDGCVLEMEASPSGGGSCAQLDQLERLVWEVGYTGRPEDLYRVLRAEARTAAKAKEPRNAAAAAAAASAAAGSAPSAQPETACSWAPPTPLQARAAKLFRMVDKEGRGTIDRDALVAAARQLHVELGDWDIGQALACLDAHGAINLDQFTEIIQAEELRIDEARSDAALLRRLHHSRPAWWGESAVVDHML